MPRSPSLSLPFTPPSQYACFITQTSTCPIHLILRDLISQITLSEQWAALLHEITYLLLPVLFFLPLPYVHILFIILTYLLIPWYTVLLEKPTGLQLVKKFPTFHGTLSFITALTSVLRLSLIWASPIQSIYPQPISWRPILILSTHLHLGLHSGLFPSSFPITTTTNTNITTTYSKPRTKRPIW